MSDTTAIDMSGAAPRENFLVEPTIDNIVRGFSDSERKVEDAQEIGRGSLGRVFKVNTRNKRCREF